VHALQCECYDNLNFIAHGQNKCHYVKDHELAKDKCIKREVHILANIHRCTKVKAFKLAMAKNKCTQEKSIKIERDAQMKFVLT
jgi:hypothetical protein